MQANSLLINESWVSFICYYIVGVTEGDSQLSLMKANEYEGLHPKKTYSEYMETEQEVCKWN